MNMNNADSLCLKSFDPGQKHGPERVALLVANILEKGDKCKATDIYIEPWVNKLQVCFRVDGVILPSTELPRELGPNIIARLKFLANLLSYRQDIPQEGRIIQIDSLEGIEVRVSTFPTIHGERVALRLFRRENRQFILEELGLEPGVLKNLKDAIGERTGAILFTGPGGSGKTTSIYSCLSHIAKTEKTRRHIVTLEDPVEQILEGVSQTQVSPSTGFDFSLGLRSLLRQDPEVILVGEMRDPETARVAIEAALSGHLLFSTLHAGSSCGVISRLLEMGIEPYLLTSSLRLILNQRLLRKNCPKCKGNGCADCNNTGYQGRLLLLEAMVLNEDMRRAILNRADRTTLEEIFVNNGGITLVSHAIAVVKEGQTTREEVLRVLGSADCAKVLYSNQGV
jgi:type II secretory ATPase GspE/PulE/Tfp pilus assembly ATPase PilB-like protein